MQTFFYTTGAVAVAATLLMILSLNAVHALLYLIVSLLAVAVIFYILGAPFVAALEVIVYAGAIMVLFIFVVMMLNLGRRAADQERAWLRPAMWIGPSILAAILLTAVSGETHSTPLCIMSFTFIAGFLLLFALSGRGFFS